MSEAFETYSKKKTHRQPGNRFKILLWYTSSTPHLLNVQSLVHEVNEHPANRQNKRTKINLKKKNASVACTLLFPNYLKQCCVHFKCNNK